MQGSTPDVASPVVAGLLGAAAGALIVELTRLGSLAQLLADNRMGGGARVRACVLVLGLGLAAFAAALIARRRQRQVQLNRVLCMAAPLAIAFALPPLFVRRLWQEAEIELLIYAGVVGVVLERLLRIAFAELAGAGWDWAPSRGSAAAGPRPRWIAYLPAIATAAAVVGYFLIISRGTSISHQRMQTSSSDLAEFDNLFFNALHAHPFRAPAIDGDLADWSALKVHAELLLYLLLPGYALAPGPEQLLRIQTAFVALTALPIHALAARRLGGFAGFAVALAYLLMPAVQRPNFYDFHFTPAGMFFVACTLCGYDRATGEPPLSALARRRASIATAVCFALALLSREDVAATLAVAFFLLALARVSPRQSFTYAAVAAGYTLLIKFVLMPAFGHMWFDSIYARLKAPGFSGLAAVLVTLATNPVFAVRALLNQARLLYLLHMTVPLLFLWNRRASLWLAALPALFFTLLVTDRAAMNEVSFQYTYLWIPYVVAASVLGLCALAASDPLRWPRKAAALAALLVVALALCWNMGALLGNPSIVGGFGEKRLRIGAEDRERLAQLHSLIARIPATASVSATEQEGPHVSTRLVLYSLKLTFGDPDYVLVGPRPFAAELANLTRALRSGSHGLLAEAGPFTLLQRGADPGRNRRLLQRWRGR